MNPDDPKSVYLSKRATILYRYFKVREMNLESLPSLSKEEETRLSLAKDWDSLLPHFYVWGASLAVPYWSFARPEDLMSAVIAGLMLTAETHDPAKGRFSVLAKCEIRGQLFQTCRQAFSQKYWAHPHRLERLPFRAYMLEPNVPQESWIPDILRAMGHLKRQERDIIDLLYFQDIRRENSRKRQFRKIRSYRDTGGGLAIIEKSGIVKGNLWKAYDRAIQKLHKRLTKLR